MGAAVTRLERRFAERRAVDASEPVSRVRLRGGRELVVIDVSSTGAFVRGDVRLLPGTHIDIHIVGADGRVLARSRVVRARVSAVWGDRIEYCGALAFERPIDVSGYAVPGDADLSVDVSGSTYPEPRM